MGKDQTSIALDPEPAELNVSAIEQWLWDAACVGLRITHRPIWEILDDLEAAKIEREQADAHPNAVLIKLGLSEGAK